MHIVVAPQALKGSLTAKEHAAELTSGATETMLRVLRIKL